MLRRMQGVYFDWSCWRAGTLVELGVANRFVAIKENANILRQHAIGWCPGEQVVCRQKTGLVAVMFWVAETNNADHFNDERLFWTHIRQNEFEEVFGRSNVLVISQEVKKHGR
jgi:hypothetical protein